MSKPDPVNIKNLHFIIFYVIIKIGEYYTQERNSKETIHSDTRLPYKVAMLQRGKQTTDNRLNESSCPTTDRYL